MKNVSQMDKDKIFASDFLSKVLTYEFENTFLDQMPKISVVMPSFNHSKYIEKSILSVINQNYKNKELIIMDGGSTDNTLNILKKYHPYIKYWVSEKDDGQCDALNKGFKLCSGQIYCWLNSDDLFLPGAFQTVAKEYIKNKKNKVWFGDWLSIDENDNILDQHYAFDFNINHLKFEGFHSNAQSFFWRNDVHKDFSGFDLKCNKTMDYQMMIEFGIKNENKSFMRLESNFAAFRRYEGQKTGGYYDAEDFEHRYLAKKYNYQEKFSYIGKFMRLFFRFRRAIWYFKRGGMNEFLKRLVQSIKKSEKI